MDHVGSNSLNQEPLSSPLLLQRSPECYRNETVILLLSLRLLAPQQRLLEAGNGGLLLVEMEYLHQVGFVWI